jgi:small-conductance mechanosensitive channel
MDSNQLLGDLDQLLLQFKQTLYNLLPNLLLSIVILIAGVLVARLLQSLVKRFILNLHRIVVTQKLRSKLEKADLDQSASLVSKIIFWIIVFFFLTVATQVLGLPIITTWLGGLVHYMPNILVAAVIVFLGIVGGKLLRDMIITTSGATGLAYIPILGKAVQFIILFITILIAIDQIGVNIEILTTVIDIVLAAMLFGAALAFGLGAKTSVSNILASYYIQKNYKEGQTIKIGEFEGSIIQINPTVVTIDTPDGIVSIPAKKFSENISILLKK